MFLRRAIRMAALSALISCASVQVSIAGMVGLVEIAAASRAGSSAEEASLALARQIAESSQSARLAIEKNDVRALTELHLRLQQSIAVLREHIDEAILRGAWKDQAARPRAFEILSRLEGMRILSKINVTFLTGYPSPTGKVSASVADATERLLRQAQILSEEIAAVNKVLPAPASAQP